MLRNIVFTGAITILGGVHQFSNSNKTFFQKLNTDSESAQKTDERTFPSVSLSFEWDIYQFVELDELILVVCSVFAHRPQMRKLVSFICIG
jgi:hypothetical protein